MKWALRMGLPLCLLGCDAQFEGDFAGEREFNIQALSGPYVMRKVQLGSQDYLAVLNTNFQRLYETGSLQFYSLSDPSNPVIEEELSVELPSAASDFYLVNEPEVRLFVLDRVSAQVLIYDWSGNDFEALKNDSGEKKTISVGRNPQRLLYFESLEGEVPHFAIAEQSGGTIYFVDIEELRLLDLDDIEASVETFNSPQTHVRVDSAGRFGAFLYMSRRSSSAAEKIRGIGSAQQRGQGISEMALIEGSESQMIVASSFLNTAVFGFDPRSWTNRQNLFWNLQGFQKGFKKDEGQGDKVEGSGESGFRGMSVDGVQNIYLSSRTDSQIYKIPKDEELFFEALEVSDDPTSFNDFKNTIAFKRNERPYRLEIEFDSTEDYARLGDLEVDGQLSQSAAEFAWVIGSEEPKLYMVDLIAEQVVDTHEFSEDLSPQRLYWDENEELLYVAHPIGNQIDIFTVDRDLGSLELVSSIAP